MNKIAKNIAKKGVMFFGIFLLFLVGLAVVIPMVVNVDQYRPQLIEAANQEINGTLDLGKLHLSLWGQIRIQVDGLKLKTKDGREVVSVKEAYFHLPFSSILSGSPSMIFKMKQPLVRVVKNKAGKLNVMSLMPEKKKTSPSTGGSATAAAPSSPSKGSSVALPGLVTRARLGVQLDHATISYQDQVSNLTTDVKDLNLILKDISLSRPTEMELWADLDTRFGKEFLMKGPARLTAKAQPQMKNGQFEAVRMTARLDMDGVEMSVPGTFHKSKGMPTEATLDLMGSEKEVKIESLKVNFFNIEALGRGTVANLTAPEGAPAADPLVSFTVQSNEIQFKPWVELVPMLKEYELGGSALFNASVNGPVSKIGYKAKLAFSNLTAKAPKLKAQPRFDGSVSVVTDAIDQFVLTMKAPGNEMRVDGKLVSFTHPNLNLQIQSTGLDLDQLIEFPPPAKAQAGESSKAGSGTAGATGGTSGGATTASGVAPGSKEDLDALLNPLRENKILAAFVANANVQIKHIKAYGVKLTDVGCKMTFKDLEGGMDACGFNIFSGSIKSNARFQLKPKTPTYQFGLNVSGLQLAQAMESQLALFKNTLMGKAFFTMTGQGSSFNTPVAMETLKAKGNMKVEQATFATIDVMRMVGEALNQTINKVSEKIPALKGKSLGALPNQASKYESVTCDFTISDGKFSAPNFFAKALPNQGIDLKGKTTVGLKDQSLDTYWEVIDTYNVTHARDLSIEQAGVKVEHVLAEGNNPVKFPVHANCTIKAPCYSYTEVPEFLAKIALNNVGHAVAGRAKQEVRKQAEAVIQKAVPALGEHLKGLFQ